MGKRHGRPTPRSMDLLQVLQSYFLQHESRHIMIDVFLRRRRWKAGIFFTVENQMVLQGASRRGWCGDLCAVGVSIPREGFSAGVFESVCVKLIPHIL